MDVDVIMNVSTIQHDRILMNIMSNETTQECEGFSTGVFDREKRRGGGGVLGSK